MRDVAECVLNDEDAFCSIRDRNFLTQAWNDLEVVAKFLKSML